MCLFSPRLTFKYLTVALAVAVRSLRLQELAGVLAVDFSTAGVGIPKLNED